MRHSRSSLFLMEIILAILFFSLASTVCIRLFARSHLISNQTVLMGHAVKEAQNLAEVFRSSDGAFNTMSSVFDSQYVNCTTDDLTLFYDSAWNPVPEETGVFCSTLKLQDSNNASLLSAHISVEKMDGSDPLYTLQIVHHVPERRGNLE